MLSPARHKLVRRAYGTIPPWEATIFYPYPFPTGNLKNLLMSLQIEAKKKIWKS